MRGRWFALGFALGALMSFVVYYSAGRVRTVAARNISRNISSEIKPPASAGKEPVKPGTIGLPIAGLTRSDLRDSFEETRFGHKHEAIDILSPRGTPVLAVVDGTIAKLLQSNAGGNTIYEFDDSHEYCYYYAHLDRYADGLVEGQKVNRGQVIGYVGSTGDAQTPHLHFGITLPGPDGTWHGGTPVNPYPILLDSISSRESGRAS